MMRRWHASRHPGPWAISVVHADSTERRRPATSSYALWNISAGRTVIDGAGTLSSGSGWSASIVGSVVLAVLLVIVVTNLIEMFTSEGGKAMADMFQVIMRRAADVIWAVWAASLVSSLS